MKMLENLKSTKENCTQYSQILKQLLIYSTSVPRKFSFCKLQDP